MGSNGTGEHDGAGRVVVRRRTPNDTDACATFGEDEPTTPGCVAAFRHETTGARKSDRPTDLEAAVAGQAAHTDATDAEGLPARAAALVARLEADYLIEIAHCAARSRLVADLAGLLSELDDLATPVSALVLWLSKHTSVVTVSPDDTRIAAALRASASSARRAAAQAPATTSTPPGDPANT